MSTLRFGLVGYGAWGSHHARAISSVAGARLVAICSRGDESRQRAAVEYPTAAVHADYRELLAHDDLDAIDVVLPSHLHFEVARAVLESGRHLLLEKPMTLSVVDATTLVELARTRGVRLAIGHELRLSSLWGEVKRLIDADAIGNPLYALVELWRRPYRLGSDGWRYDVNRVGNWILEEPIHFFDLARWYLSRLGNPRSVYAAANGKQADHPELHDNFSAIVKFPGGGYATISQTLAGWEHHQVVKLTGTRGALLARWSGAMDRTFAPTFRLERLENDRAVEVPIARPSGEVYELVDQLAAFVQSVRDGTPVACSGEDGRWSVAMCLAATESLRSGLPVDFPER